ncbi:hypothetical protein [Serratia entomophila]|uniref:hypothetical protein n=1 Tax=Serratia entomophila TaxID=42906 RepID=UPI001F27AB6A|nr:hypothetical protein [Serratia entomophila]UIW19500.1 hypothetical protein KHA73_06000 [Serratia entomophila]
MEIYLISLAFAIAISIAIAKISKKHKQLNNKVDVLESIISDRISDIEIKLGMLASFNEATDLSIDDIKLEQKIIYSEMERHKKIINSLMK